MHILQQKLVVWQLAGIMIQLSVIFHEAAIIRITHKFTLAKKSLSHSLHFVLCLFFLMTSAVLLVVEGFDQRLQLHYLDHVHLLQIFSENGIRCVSGGNWNQRRGGRVRWSRNWWMVIVHQFLQFLLNGKLSDIVLEPRESSNHFFSYRLDGCFSLQGLK